MKLAIVALLMCVVGCDEKPSAIDCATASEYLQPQVLCDNAHGACVAKDDQVLCLPRCASTSPMCGPGEHWMTIQVSDGPPLCYCDVE